MTPDNNYVDEQIVKIKRNECFAEIGTYRYAVLTWTGNYYFRVRFEDDELDLSRTWQALWENAEIKMITVK